MGWAASTWVAQPNSNHTTGTVMHGCTECGTTYTSRLAAEECADFDIQEARNTREWFNNYDPNRRD